MNQERSNYHLSGCMLSGALLLSVLGFPSCSDLVSDEGQGELIWSFSGELYSHTKSSGVELPDTNDFILTVADSKGEKLYDGKYGDSPESLLVTPGSYTVSVRSGTFPVPCFDAPQYGDDQVVVVSSGESADVKLQCVQVNSGIRLKIAPDFLETYPDGVLFVQSEEGKLMYSYSERRIAYFNPGPVKLTMTRNSGSQTLFTRQLESREVLCVAISAASKSGGSSSGSSISICIDTSRNWSSESYQLGGGSQSAGGTIENALSVSQAKSSPGLEGVWVYGYIVGGDLTSGGSTFNTGPKFSKSTHLALASRSSVTSKSSCIAVELPSGTVREALNLVDNPALIGKRVYVKGDIVDSYFGITGVKKVSEYVLK